MDSIEFDKVPEAHGTCFFEEESFVASTTDHVIGRGFNFDGVDWFLFVIFFDDKLFNLVYSEMTAIR